VRPTLEHERTRVGCREAKPNRTDTTPAGLRVRVRVLQPVFNPKPGNGALANNEVSVQEFGASYLIGKSTSAWRWATMNPLSAGTPGPEEQTS